jgi:hypothetical protein
MRPTGAVASSFPAGLVGRVEQGAPAPEMNRPRLIRQDHGSLLMIIFRCCLPMLGGVGEAEAGAVDEWRESAFVDSHIPRRGARIRSCSSMRPAGVDIALKFEMQAGVVMADRPDGENGRKDWDHPGGVEMEVQGIDERRCGGSGYPMLAAVGVGCVDPPAPTVDFEVVKWPGVGRRSMTGRERAGDWSPPSRRRGWG